MRANSGAVGEHDVTERDEIQWGVQRSHLAWIRRLVPGFCAHHAQGGKGQILHSICHLLCRLDGEVQRLSAC